MEQVRRHCNRDKEGWWCWPGPPQGVLEACWKVKLREGGEEKLSGIPDDKSELLLTELFQNATHVKQTDNNIETRFLEIFEADDPVPYLEALELCGPRAIGPIVDAIKSEKLSNLKYFAWQFYAATETGSARFLQFALMEHINLAQVMESGKMLALEKLNLSVNFMGPKQCKAYANAIASGKLPCLKCINFSNNRIGSEGIEAFLQAIASAAFNNLTGFNVGNNQIHSGCIEALGRAIASDSFNNLTELNLTWNDIAGENNQRAHIMLAENMGSGRMPALETLGLHKTRMRDDGCKAYAQAMSSGKFPSLRCIHFAHNFLGNSSADAIAGALRSGKLKNLTRLDLSYNCITDEGIIVLAKAFEEGDTDMLPNLIYLDLSNNNATEVGLVSFAAALKSGRLNSLNFLGLRQASGKVSREAASIFVVAFSSNFHLTVDVDIWWQEFPDLHRRVEQLAKRNKRTKDISAGLVDSLVVPAGFGKIYLCGSPEVGKTTLSRTLQRHLKESSVRTWLRRPHVEKRTRGIEVSQFSSQPIKQGESLITLQVWDMAGQEDYHVVHNAFFPDLGYAKGKATSFVVVCGSSNVEKESKEQVQDWLEQLVYWLKFIASSCGKSTDRRHVFVVLNNFYRRLQVSTYNRFWEQGLELLEEEFKEYLNIQTDAFIMDVRKYRFVQPLKRHLLEHSRSLLKHEMIPDICQSIQQNLTRWSETREKFPVLHWPDFVDQVHQCSSERWPEETLETATKYLNEAGVLIYIDKQPPTHWNMHYRKLVVLNPSWLCREIVGNMFLREDMGYPTDILFRKKVDGNTGSIPESDFKTFFTALLGTPEEWSDEDVGDLITILLWLGLCYKGSGQQLFIPALMAESSTPWDRWKSGASTERGEDQWVMGFSVEHSKSKVTLAPIALWHRFQVQLAQTPKFNGRSDNDFVTGKYFITFCADDMSVLIEVRVDKGSPTFKDISIFVKPLREVEDLDGNRRKQYQVDLASDLVEILLGLWIEVCPGVEYLHKVVWPWPASQHRREVMPEKNVEVEEVKKWVQEHGLGRSMLWMVGSSTVKEDQLLATKDKEYAVGKYQGVLHATLDMLMQFEREAVIEGICPANEPLVEVPSREVRWLSWLMKRGWWLHAGVSSVAPEETEMSSLPRSASGKLLMRKMESMEKKILEQLDNIEDVVRDGFKEVMKKEKDLLDKLQDTGEFILQDGERICPRFIYLVEKDSGAWMTLKAALSPKKTARLHFLC